MGVVFALVYAALWSAGIGTATVAGGPAGLTAAIYLAREGPDTLVIEKAGLGGQAGLESSCWGQIRIF